MTWNWSLPFEFFFENSIVINIKILSKFIDNLEKLQNVKLAIAGRLGLSVSVAWISAHACILGNEVADSIARIATRLQFLVHCGISWEDIMRVLR